MLFSKVRRVPTAGVSIRSPQRFLPRLANVPSRVPTSAKLQQLPRNWNWSIRTFSTSRASSAKISSLFTNIRIPFLPLKPLPVPTDEQLNKLSAEQLCKLGLIWTAPPVKSMKPDPAVAHRVWQFAIDKYNCPNAKYHLGGQLITVPLTGPERGTQREEEILEEFRQNAQRGLKLLEESAAAGNARAASLLGVVYSKGMSIIGIQPDIELAVKYHATAWETGKLRTEPYTIYKLLKDSDPALAFAWLRVAADEADDTEAQMQLASILKDHSVPTDSMYNMERNLTFPKVSEKLPCAAYYYKKLADKNVAEAYYNLALCFLEGACGAPKDERLALRYFFEAANRGIIMASYYVGKLYATKQGVAKDDRSILAYWSQVLRSNESVPQLLVSAYLKHVADKLKNELAAMRQKTDNAQSESTQEQASMK